MSETRSGGAQHERSEPSRRREEMSGERYSRDDGTRLRVRETKEAVWSESRSVVYPLLSFPSSPHPLGCRPAGAGLRPNRGRWEDVRMGREADQTVTKGLSSSSKFSGSCVPTLQTLPWSRVHLVSRLALHASLHSLRSA